MSFRKSFFSAALVAGMASMSQAAENNFHPNWRWIKADDGSQSAIDINTIAHTIDGGATAVVYFERGSMNWMQDSRRYKFDCRGHFMDIDNGQIVLPAQRGSVIGALANIACQGARESRFDGIPICETDPVKRDKQSLCRSYTH